MCLALISADGQNPAPVGRYLKHPVNPGQFEPPIYAFFPTIKYGFQRDSQVNMPSMACLELLPHGFSLIHLPIQPTATFQGLASCSLRS